MIKTTYGMIMGTYDDVCRKRRVFKINSSNMQYSGYIWLYLVRPRVVGLGVSHHNQRHHCSAVEDPCREAEEINQRVDGAVANHGGRDNGLRASAKIQI